MLAAIEKAGYRAVAVTAEETKFGAVETRAEAARCAELFQRHRDQIDGVIVTLPNFGDERAIADTLRMAGLNVPVLVQATPDTPGRMTIRDRRDSFCGKMSACNNLTQYGIPYSLTTLHTEAPDSEFFRKDLDWFAAVCRVVRGLRRLRIGAIGARPAAFNTVRYSEKILEANGISVETIDLSEILGRIARMADQDPAAQAKLEHIQRYVSTDRVPAEALLKMAKLGAVIDGWMRGDRSRHQRRAMLDVARRVLRRGALHRDEHDERESDVERLRGGYLRRGGHACSAARLRNAQRPARLEQQLRRRSGQGRVLPLQQSSQAFLQGGAHGFPGDHRRHGGQGEHLRHLRGPREIRADELRALFNQRSHGIDPRLRRRRRVHRRSAGYFRRRGRGAHSKAAGACCAIFASAASSITSPPTWRRWRRPCVRPPRATWAGACINMRSNVGRLPTCGDCQSAWRWTRRCPRGECERSSST